MTRQDVLNQIPGLKSDRLASWLNNGVVATMFDAVGLRRDFTATDVRRIRRLTELTANGMTLATARRVCDEQFARASRKPLEYSNRDWLFV